MTKKQDTKEPRGRQQCPAPKGILIAIGGREDKGEELNDVQKLNKNFIAADILKRFVDET